MTLIVRQPMHVEAEVYAANGELIAGVAFDTNRSAQGAVGEAMARLTREMDYSTAYWKKLTITCELKEQTDV